MDLRKKINDNIDKCMILINEIPSEEEKIKALNALLDTLHWVNKALRVLHK